jgi:hypothetical protein
MKQFVIHFNSDFVIYVLGLLRYLLPITVAAQSKVWTVFTRSNTGIVGSNPTRGMNVCVRLFCVCAVLYTSSGLATGWFPVQGVLLTMYNSRNWKSGQGPTKGRRAIDRETDKEIFTAIPAIQAYIVHFGEGCCSHLVLVFVTTTDFIIIRYYIQTQNRKWLCNLLVFLVSIAALITVIHNDKVGSRGHYVFTARNVDLTSQVSITTDSWRVTITLRIPNLVIRSPYHFSFNKFPSCAVGDTPTLSSESPWFGYWHRNKTIVIKVSSWFYWVPSGKCLDTASNVAIIAAF